MKQKKLKSYVLPTVYVIILMLIFGTVSIVSTLLQTTPNYLYSVNVVDETSLPVFVSDGGITSIIKPFLSENVSIDKYFYDEKSDEETQVKSLIYFENTYMKNTGVLYKSNEVFDCVAVLNGTIKNITEDEILGTIIEVEHNTNLRTIYYTLDNVNVKIGDVVGQGETIATSGISRISEENNTLLFEVYYNGSVLNPLEFYEMDPATLN